LKPDEPSFYETAFGRNYPLAPFDPEHPEKALTADTAAKALKALDAVLNSAGGPNRAKYEDQRKLLEVLADTRATCTLTFISHSGSIFAALPADKKANIHPEPIDQQYVTAVCDAGDQLAGYRLRAQDGDNGAFKQLTFPMTARQARTPRA